MRRLVLFILLVLLSHPVAADLGLTAVTVANNPNGGQSYSVTLQILAMMTMLTLLPAALMMMTSFTRIIVGLLKNGRHDKQRQEK